MKSTGDGFGPPPHHPQPEHEPPEHVPSFEERQAVIEARAFAEVVSRQRPTVTYAIIAVNVVFFGLQFLTRQALIETGANVSGLVHEGEWWRLWAATLLHGGLMHIFFNMAALRAIGPLLESVLGHARFLVLYALCGLAGSVAGVLLNTTGPGSIGASGAIWGLMGAGFGLALRPRGLLPRLTAGMLKRPLLETVVLNALISFVPGIDKWAHFGGGGAGFLLVVSGLVELGARPIYRTDVPESRVGRMAWNGLAVLFTAAMLGSGGVALIRALSLATPT